MKRSSCHLTHIRLEGNLGPIVERLHRSLVSVGPLLSVLPASMVQRIARRELTLPHLEELNCILNLGTFTDLKNMVEALWSNREDSYGAVVRGVSCCRCKIARGSATGEENFGRCENEMRVLFNRLSIDGWVEFLDDDNSFVDGEWIYEIPD